MRKTVGAGRGEANGQLFSIQVWGVALTLGCEKPARDTEDYNYTIGMSFRGVLKVGAKQQACGNSSDDRSLGGPLKVARW